MSKLASKQSRASHQLSHRHSRAKLCRNGTRNPTPPHLTPRTSCWIRGLRLGCSLSKQLDLARKWSTLHAPTHWQSQHNIPHWHTPPLSPWTRNQGRNRNPQPQPPGLLLLLLLQKSKKKDWNNLIPNSRTGHTYPGCGNPVCSWKTRLLC